jgi:hypothetical protein
MRLYVPFCELASFTAANNSLLDRRARFVWMGAREDSYWEALMPIPRRLLRFLNRFPAPRRISLGVPYAEKDAAKALGAKWDAEARVWFCPLNADAARFVRWIPVSENLLPLITAAAVHADEASEEDDSEGSEESPEGEGGGAGEEEWEEWEEEAEEEGGGAPAPPPPPRRELSAAVESRLEARKDLECAVCVSLLHEPVVLDCGHSFCVGCALGALSVKRACPLCRLPSTPPRPNFALRTVVDAAIADAEKAVAAAAGGGGGAGGGPEPEREGRKRSREEVSGVVGCGGGGGGELPTPPPRARRRALSVEEVVDLTGDE